MQVLSALVAVAAGQGFFGLQAGPDGTITPLDEPAVAAARADHLALKFGTTGAAYSYAAGYPHAAIDASAYDVAGANIWSAPYAGPLHYPQLVAHPNGAVVPADEPAVAAARAEHLAAHGAAYGGIYATSVAEPLVAAPELAYAPAYTGPLHYPQLVAYPNGAVVPADEPAVVAARAEHLAAHGAAYGGVYAATEPLAAAPALTYAPAYARPLHYPQLVAYPNGAVVPADEPAVAAARAEHLAAHGAAYGGIYATAVAEPLIAAPELTYAPAYTGPLHYPQLVAHPNGAVVPADEPAVVAARAEHLAAHGAVYGGVYASAAAPVAGGYAPSFYGLVAHPNGAIVPVDEPAVAAARAEHLAAHGK